MGAPPPLSMSGRYIARPKWIGHAYLIEFEREKTGPANTGPAVPAAPALLYSLCMLVGYCSLQVTIALKFSRLKLLQILWHSHEISPAKFQVQKSVARSLSMKICFEQIKTTKSIQLENFRLYGIMS